MRRVPDYDKFVYQWSEEFKLLGEYLSYLEKSIPSIRSDITKILWHDVAWIDDGDQNIPSFGLIHPESAPKIFLRFLFNNCFLSLWATYETGITEIANFLSEADRKRTFRSFVNKQKGTRKSFVDYIFLYFKEIHKIDMPVTDSFNQESLRYLLKLRNVIAHSNGRANDVSKTLYAGLGGWIDKQPEIMIERNGWIYLNHKFCYDTYNGLSTLFNDLSKLAYEKALNKAPRPVKGYQVIY